MGEVKIREIIKDTIGQIFWIIGLIVSVIGNLLLFVQQKLPEFFCLEPLSKSLFFVMVCAVAGVSFLFAIPCVIVINYRIYKRNKLSIELNGLAGNLKDSIHSCENLSTSIKSLPQIGDIIQRSYQLNSIKSFYKHLNKARNRIQESEDKNIIIRLTNYADTISEEKDAKNYFENEIKFCNDKSSVQVFKIVSIHTAKKFRQCKKLVDDAIASKLQNFHLAYLNIKEFDNNNLPKIIGVQIIEDEVILMDPSFARIDLGNNDKNPLFIKSSKIAEIYFNYHDQLWSEIAEYHANQSNYENNDGYSGYILYDGEVEKPIDNNIWKKINSNMPESEQLGREDLKKIGIV